MRYSHKLKEWVLRGYYCSRHKERPGRPVPYDLECRICEIESMQKKLYIVTGERDAQARIGKEHELRKLELLKEIEDLNDRIDTLLTYTQISEKEIVFRRSEIESVVKQLLAKDSCWSIVDYAGLLEKETLLGKRFSPPSPPSNLPPR